MAALLNTERAPLADWQAESLRLTVFLSPSTQIIPETWWRDIVGEEPESTTSQPKRRALVQEGTAAGGRLILSVEPTRIDWRMIPIQGQNRESDPFPTIGILPDVVNTFIHMIRHWFELKTYPMTKRLAFGAVLLQFVNDRKLAYQQISSYLPSVIIDIQNSTDLFYRINRPRPSTSGSQGLKINRLSTWAVRAGALSELSVGSESAQVTLTPISHACLLELDINTALEFPEEFSAKESLTVFQELVDLGLEVAREGDIK